MPRTSLALRTLLARPRSKNYTGSNEDVDGVHIMAHLAGFLRARTVDPIKDERRVRYLRVKEVIPRGRSLTIVTQSGYYGERGVTYDVNTHEQTHEKSEDEAATVETRTTFWAPPGAKYIVIAIELRPGALHGGMVLDAFRSFMRDTHDTFFYPSETVMEKDAWAASGELKEVSVILHERPLDYSVSIDEDRKKETVLGRRVYTALPPRGQGTWPSKVWDGLRSGQIKAGTFVGVRTVDEESTDSPDEDVYVTVERDGRKKKFELGSDGVPSIRLALTDDHEPALDIDDFHVAVDHSVRDFYDNEDAGWDPRWAQETTALDWVAYGDRA